MSDVEDLDIRMACKLLVGKVTHTLCNILDDTRAMNPKLRYVILKEVEQDLLRRLEHIPTAKDLTLKQKRQSLKKIASDLKKLNPKRRRGSLNDNLFS